MKIEERIVSNGIYTLEFKDGFIENISTNSSHFKLMQQMVRYSGHNSGAYEFNPQVVHS